jgi:N-acetylmuramoyl-L-alanine amidase
MTHRLTRTGSSAKKDTDYRILMRFYRCSAILSAGLSLFFLIVPGLALGLSGLFPIQKSPPIEEFAFQTASKPSKTHVRNIRAHRHKKFTRVVMDLTNLPNLAPQDRRTTTHFHIEIPRATVDKKAGASLTGTTFPLVADLSTSPQGSVVLTVPTAGWKSYKWYLLKNPSRLVLDLYPTETHATDHPNTGVPTSPSPLKKPEVILPPVQEKRDFLVVIDPGHGGKDPGALGKSGTREKDVVLAIALHLRDILLKEPSVKVLMTRETDRFIELEDRAHFANKEKADLFVSIHINSHPKSTIKGLEFYHFGEASDPRALEVAARENGTPLEDNAPAWQFILADKLNDKKIDDSREFAWTTKKAVMKHLNPYYKIKDHGVKTAPFFVLRMTTMPAILAEIAFISNPTEEKLLRSPTYQQRMAQGIFEGIRAFITPPQTALK